MYGAKLRLFFDNTKLFGLYFAFSCKLFQYILYLIRQKRDSLVFHILRNAKSGFGDGADDGSDGIAIAAMRYGESDGINNLILYSITSQKLSGRLMFFISFAFSNNGAMSSASKPAMPQPIGVTRKCSSGC